MPFLIACCRVRIIVVKIVYSSDQLVFACFASKSCFALKDALFFYVKCPARTHVIFILHALIYFRFSSSCFDVILLSLFGS